MIGLVQYVEKLQNTLSGSYNVMKNPVVADRTFLLAASHTCTLGRTFITRKDVIDKFDIQNIILVIAAENLNQVTELCRWLKENIREIANPGCEKYLTLINLVVVFEKPVSDDIKKFVEHYFFSKSFLLSIHGWAQAGITGVCLYDCDVFCGKNVLEMKGLFDPKLCLNPPEAFIKQPQTGHTVVNNTSVKEEAVKWQSYF